MTVNRCKKLILRHMFELAVHCQPGMQCYFHCETCSGSAEDEPILTSEFIAVPIMMTGMHVARTN